MPRIVLDLAPCEIVGDVDMLGIAMRNLIDNAVRYAGDAGRIEVRCASEGGQVSLRVADDGPGVPPDERSRVFDRFYRLPGAPGRGSGVGLSLVARIAEVHRARVEAGAGLDGRGFGVTLWFAAAPPATRATPRTSDSADTRSRFLGDPIQR
jgi:two-component system OmpR family sensor kinase